MKLSNDELEEKVDRYKEKVENFTGMWDEIPDERRSRIYGAVGRRKLAVGGYSALNDDVEAARNWFEHASEWYRKGVERCPGHINQVNRHYWALQTAILAKSQSARDAAMGLTVEDPDVQYLEDYAVCLEHLLADVEEAAIQTATVLVETAASMSEVPYYAGLGETAAAIVDEDLEALDAGLQIVLDHHEGLVPKLGETMDDGLICYPATSLLILAEERGFDVERLEVYDNEYIPWELVEAG